MSWGQKFYVTDLSLSALRQDSEQVQCDETSPPLSIKSQKHYGKCRLH